MLLGNAAIDIKSFFFEIFQILSRQDRSITEVWIEVSNLEFLKEFKKFSQVRDFLYDFNFIKIKDGNYVKNAYIVIDKIQFICESMMFLDLDLRNLAILLDFSGFESLVKEILFRHGYRALKNFRFSNKTSERQKRFEIDVIGIKRNLILIIDAKQWMKKDSPAAMSKAANMQFQRVVALKNNSVVFSDMIQELLGKKAKIRKNLPFVLIPLMISLEDNYLPLNENNIPLVSIYRFNSFLNELNLNLQTYKHVMVNKISLQKQLI
ncbi:MAG: hypothetical protein JW891_01010 [Candidatus Lokiarchaeota archaeon]|nr:hypothetical protein [Candidatus Lokiarchaeota archaeon]